MPTEANVIEAVIFDLGRVLVGLDLSRGLVARLTDTDPAHFEELVARLYNEELFVDFATGRLEPAGFHRAACARFGVDWTFEEFAAVWCDIFAPMPGMAELVAEVAARVPVGLLSDTDPLHWEYELRAQPWLAIFSRPTLSFRIGALKPDPRCYLRAAADVGRPIERCLFVDDLEANVAGARAVGMQAVNFAGAKSLRAELLLRGVLS